VKFLVLSIKTFLPIPLLKDISDALDGISIIVSHIDSPRLDLKQNPLYEDVNLGLLKTHYYGGIKKYQL